MLDIRYWIDKLSNEPGYTDASNYGVELFNNFKEPGWRVSCHKLTPLENQGNHNIFFRIIDTNGSINNMQAVKLSWEGMSSSEGPIYLRDQKGHNELADFAMFAHRDIAMEISGHCKITGLTALLPDEPNEQFPEGNTIGHHSFLVLFRHDSSFVEPGPDLEKPQPEPEPQPEEPDENKEPQEIDRTIKLQADIVTRTWKITTNKADFIKWFSELPEDEDGITWFNLLCYSNEKDRNELDG